MQIIFNFSENAYIRKKSNLFVNRAPAANISIQFKRNVHILDAVMLLYSTMSSQLIFAKLFSQTHCKHACNFVVIRSILIKIAYSVSGGMFLLLFEVFCFLFCYKKVNKT